MADTYTLADAAMKIIQDRRSIRHYTDEAVADGDLDLILEAGRQAPSGEDAQPWRFIVVRDARTRAWLGSIAGGGAADASPRSS